MGDLQAHVLLHPVRMRVVLALGASELTTKQIQAQLPDVAQASLYRAIARLADAGVLDVVARRKRGGALERVYKVRRVPDPEYVTSTASEFVAAADALAGSLSLDAARSVAAGAWGTEVAALRRQTLRLTSDQYDQIRRLCAETLASIAAEEPAPDAVPYSVTFAAIPHAHDAVLG